MSFFLCLFELRIRDSFLAWFGDKLPMALPFNGIGAVFSLSRYYVNNIRELSHLSSVHSARKEIRKKKLKEWIQKKTTTKIIIQTFIRSVDALLISFAVAHDWIVVGRCCCRCCFFSCFLCLSLGSMFFFSLQNANGEKKWHLMKTTDLNRTCLGAQSSLLYNIYSPFQYLCFCLASISICLFGCTMYIYHSDSGQSTRSVHSYLYFLFFIPIFFYFWFIYNDSKPSRDEDIGSLIEPVYYDYDSNGQTPFSSGRHPCAHYNGISIQ